MRKSMASLLSGSCERKLIAYLRERPPPVAPTRAWRGGSPVERARIRVALTARAVQGNLRAAWLTAVENLPKRQGEKVFGAIGSGTALHSRLQASAPDVG